MSYAIQVLRERLKMNEYIMKVDPRMKNTYYKNKLIKETADLADAISLLNAGNKQVT
nr:hypothetical protein [uncultured Draconibacterium sp.]